MKRHAFTLIELLVVIAIIALLIAIIVPSLGKARQRVDTSKCIANVRNMGTATQLYVSDWRHMFPCYGLDTTHSWTQLLANNGTSGPGGAIRESGGYGGTEKMRTCPESLQMNPVSTPFGFGGGFAANFGTAHMQWGNSPATGQDIGGSYGLNGWSYNRNGGDTGFLNLLANDRGTATSRNFYKIPSQGAGSTAPLIADATWRHVFAKPTDPVPTNLESPGPNDPFSNPISKFMINRHNKAINVVFADTHAETVKLQDLYKVRWTANWIAPGYTPKLPPK